VILIPRDEDKRKGMTTNLLESKNKTEFGIRLFIFILVLFLYSLIISFLIFGVIDTYQFVSQSYVSPFWFMTLIIFASLTAFFMVAIAIAKKS